LSLAELRFAISSEEHLNSLSLPRKEKDDTGNNIMTTRVRSWSGGLAEVAYIDDADDTLSEVSAEEVKELGYWSDESNCDHVRNHVMLNGLESGKQLSTQSLQTLGGFPSSSSTNSVAAASNVIFCKGDAWSISLTPETPVWTRLNQTNT
jgi:hypothetical protein